MYMYIYIYVLSIEKIRKFEICQTNFVCVFL